MKINIAIGGGHCTGKSTLAAALFAKLKEMDYDYDLIAEEARKLKKEWGGCRNPFDRFYIWRQQEREELRSTAKDGFITDTPLFHLYVQARQYLQEPRDQLAVRELFRMCMEIQERYQIFVMAEDPLEIPYRTDGARKGPSGNALERHKLVRSFVEHFIPERILLVKGSVQGRVETTLSCINRFREKKGESHEAEKRRNCGEERD